MNNSTNTPWFAVSVGLVGLIVGYALATGVGNPLALGGTKAPTPTPTPIANDPTPTPAGNPADADDDEVKGDPNATVTLIEFTDYECPFCKRHYDQTFPEIVKNYVDTGKVKYVVRDYPLSFHPAAQKASEATECAAEQGKFWEMHSKIFDTQGTWGADPSGSFKKYAADMGLNASTFNTCLDSGAMAAEVAKDLADGSAAGISGTPGFWIVSDDGQSKSISGAYPYATFQAAFDEML